MAVAPLVGVWIEIASGRLQVLQFCVAPLVGVWIEMSINLLTLSDIVVSLPSWECGLKYGS